MYLKSKGKEANPSNQGHRRVKNVLSIAPEKEYFVMYYRSLIVYLTVIYTSFIIYLFVTYILGFKVPCAQILIIFILNRRNIFKSNTEEHLDSTPIFKYVSLTKIKSRVISPSKTQTEDPLVASNEIVYSYYFFFFTIFLQKIFQRRVVGFSLRFLHRFIII